MCLYARIVVYISSHKDDCYGISDKNAFEAGGTFVQRSTRVIVIYVFGRKELSLKLRLFNEKRWPVVILKTLLLYSLEIVVMK